MQANKIVLSGIRPTGDLHLGNWAGAVTKFLKLQEMDGYDRYYFIADLHALTTLKEAVDIRAGTLHMMRQYLACGLDPNKATIYRQSDIMEIPYLATLLGMVAGYGRLQNCTTFKDKQSSQTAKGGRITAGLFNYPVLMAADILIVRADYVPVGEDQNQHLEMCREFASSMNSMFGTSLPEPVNFEIDGDKPVRVPGLDGSGKMGKSSGGKPINLISDPKTIRKQIMSAETDFGPVPGQPMGQAMQNLFTFMENFSSPEMVASFKARYDNGEQKFYGEMKKQIANDVIALCEPIRDRYFNDPACSEEAAIQVLQEGAEKVRPVAKEVLADALSKMGIS
ncbi:MAG: tryptophan--tRNA ligase [Proteobacteria bacterium]|nr:MAG: tryptophan--tRNA ligase [Pseudomonadota bacterium]